MAFGASLLSAGAVPESVIERSRLLGRGCFNVKCWGELLAYASQSRGFFTEVSKSNLGEHGCMKSLLKHSGLSRRRHFARGRAPKE